MSASSTMIRLIKWKPRFLLTAVPILTLSSGLAAVSIVGLAPVIDFLVQSEGRPASALTVRITGWMTGTGLPVSLLSVSVLFLLLVVFRNILMAGAKVIVTHIHFQLVRERMSELFQGILSARWQYFVQYDYGTLGNTILKETEKIGVALESIARLVTNVVRAAALMGVIFFISWKLSSVALILLCVVVAPFFLLGRVTYRIGAVHTQAANAFQGKVVETLSASKLVIGFAKQRKSLYGLAQSIKPYLATAFQFQLIRSISPLAFEPLGFLIALTVLYVGANFLTLELSSLVIILYALKSSADLLMASINEQHFLRNVTPSLEQVDRILKDACTMVQPIGSKKFEGLKREITFDQVSFAYPNRADALRNINVSIPKGCMTAFVGRSGSGKTTLVDILMGFYEPQTGHVRVDGNDLREIIISSWRRKIGYVPQDPFLFHASIRENLLWANGQACTADLKEVCDRAYATEFIRDLPQALDTVVGERGVRLSGGQRQRVALARALLHGPDILILDEATSSLDSHSELLIQKSVEQLSRHITVIVIAHRLSTIRKADCIHVVEGGTIVESGSFEQLMKIKGGEFVKTAQLQGMGNHV